VSSQNKLAMFSTPGGSLALADPPGTIAAAKGGPDPTTTPKLYQPAHQRFYLVSAALVCRLPGLPDHTINAANQEKTTFVLRRVRTITDAATGSATRAEYGFVAAPGGGAWQRISSPDTALTPAEERLPLFAVNFSDDAGQKRRVLAGLIPVGRRESYVGATEQLPPSDPEVEPITLGAGEAVDPGGPPPPVDPRIALLSADVIEPWKALVVRAAKTLDQTKDKNNVGQQTDIDQMVAASREAIQVGSWYVLLDFATFLDQQLHDVWLAITTGSTPPTQAQRDVVAAIAGAMRPAGLPAYGAQAPATLKDALAAIGAFRDPLERASGKFHIATPTAEWPNFLFPLADPTASGGPVPAVTLPPPPPGPPLTDTQVRLRKISVLRDLIAAALPATPTWAVPDLPLAAKPVLAPDETARFVIRCVLDRPECAPIDPVILSAPTREFELAAFFDPDAPARPIRISLPVDTSPAGLRRFPKNTAFVMSDMLCGQVNRAKGLGLVDLVLSVLPWPFHKDLPTAGGEPCKTDAGLSLGMICSLSIPIITIVALILLIIFVILFDIIFSWMPFFFFCFPIPKFSAKPPQP
jgi:hypothetical protein